MNIYLSGHYGDVARVIRVRNALRNQRHLVVSQWHNDGHIEETQPFSVGRERAASCTRAMADLFAIRGCELFVAVNAGQDDGRQAAEYGAAVAYGKRIVLIGERSHIFHAIPVVAEFPAHAEFLRWTAGLLEGFAREIADWMAEHGNH